MSKLTILTGSKVSFQFVKTALKLRLTPWSVDFLYRQNDSSAIRVSLEKIKTDLLKINSEMLLFCVDEH